MNHNENQGEEGPSHSRGAANPYNDTRRRSVAHENASANVPGISTIAQMLEEGMEAPMREDRMKSTPGTATFTGTKERKKQDDTPKFFSAPIGSSEPIDSPFFTDVRRSSDPDRSPEHARPDLPHQDDSTDTIKGDAPKNPSAEVSGSGLPNKSRAPVGQPQQAPTGINFSDRPGESTGEQQSFHQREREQKPEQADPPASHGHSESQQPEIQSPQPRRPANSSATSGSHRGSHTTNIELDDEGRQALVADYSGIVRLAEAGSLNSTGGTGGAGTGDSGTGSRGSAPSGPTNARLAHQAARQSKSNTRDSVRNFVNEQAHTVNLLDPNAPTPSPTPLDDRRERDTPAGDAEYPDWNESSDASRDSSEVATAASGDGNISEHEEPIVTFRFEHVATDDGHHVVVGREGMLQRCEDEPITTPGAVQGFGVLLVLEENIDTGDLLIRQVSENATELLGLSPRYLFRLECFTRVLTDEQEDLLRDNIEYLPSAEGGKGSVEEEGPQVFLLSGFGEPGSDDVDDESITSAGAGRRREWTCWVAAHRPKQPSWDKADEEGNSIPPPELIVLEFELERDTYNPLMRFPGDLDTPDSGSNTTAPSMGPRSGSTGSAGPSEGSQTTATSTPRPNFTPNSSDQTVIAPSSHGTQQPNSNEARDSSKYCSRHQPMGLEGLEVEMPLDRIIESTTNHAKPLRALERMRRTGMTDDGSSGRSGRSRRPPRRRPVGGATGTMDVFAVLGQINEQLGAAPDLEQFLKITVGVVQDLCRFHRVLIYQFDEAFNGQVVAELVEWGKTTDLFKGLMFPAADIPAQARQLYMINKVRLLYDRSQTTARMVLRNRDDLDHPLDMTHCYLRAMSPIHIKCEWMHLDSADIRSRQHACEILNVGLDHGLWSTLGSHCLSFLWPPWNAGVLPGSTNDANSIRFHLAKH